MLLLSIDVGLYNLALCLFEINDGKYTVRKWENVNIRKALATANPDPEPDPEPLIIYTCCGSIKCKQKVQYEVRKNKYCTKHFKALNIPELPASINDYEKKTVKDLKPIYCEIIKTKCPTKRGDIIASISAFIDKNYYTKIKPKTKTRKQKYEDECKGFRGSRILNLFDVGTRIKIAMQRFLAEHPPIDKVIIEQQMTATMKMVQSMLVQFFVMTSTTTTVECISASKKLITLETQKEVRTGDETNNYKNRKRWGVDKCITILQERNNAEDLAFFQNQPKRDDLADCYLQGVWYISTYYMV